ncbi:TPA: hypothetical protein OUI05_003699, partial [Acinetobacter baumannii]|nr:hypothetical protein [Acinetobacter baumannii]EKU5229265.1 hypothetical protein [Acinetobacter baumannii]EKU5653593.1 hypothetical protein [Acinetobacter baumannii]ELB1853272.1 hypothetical protein [Acinetobacter baumannii]HCU1958173.1 hypothetical protein [Acinetobacter baumannii]
MNKVYKVIWNASIG